jgi:hypothetical protein
VIVFTRSHNGREVSGNDHGRFLLRAQAFEQQCRSVGGVVHVRSLERLVKDRDGSEN